jgi:hypothetical protein
MTSHPATPAAKSPWTAEWVLTEDLGLAIDDGCFVALTRRDDGWRPTAWVPQDAARMIATLMLNDSVVERLKP